MIGNIVKNLDMGVFVRNLFIVGLAGALVWMWSKNDSLVQDNVKLTSDVITLNSDKRDLTGQLEATKAENSRWSSVVEAQNLQVQKMLDAAAGYETRMNELEGKLADVSSKYAKQLDDIRKASIPKGSQETWIWLRDGLNDSADWSRSAPASSLSQEGPPKAP